MNQYEEDEISQSRHIDLSLAPLKGQNLEKKKP
jgi:hypothetical protein